MTPDRAAQLQAIAATLEPELDPARDYPALAAQAKAGKDAGVTRKEHISH